MEEPGCVAFMVASWSFLSDLFALFECVWCVFLFVKMTWSVVDRKRFLVFIFVCVRVCFCCLVVSHTYIVQWVGLWLWGLPVWVSALA